MRAIAKGSGFCLAAALLAAGAASLPVTTQAADGLRLEWVFQGQFAGFIVAGDKGYYAAEGLDIDLRPAGPDLKPASTVATGTDSFGIGHPNQVVAARSNEVPLVMVLQFGQKSATTYISRKEKGIEKVQDMPGHSVGLWFGGDEHEFLAMLQAAGVDQSQVRVISQGFEVVNWLRDEYDVMQVTRYNELNLVHYEGIGPDQLNFLDPEDYGVALVAGGVFVTEKTIAERPEVVQGFVNASMRGWKDAIEDPKAAAEIVLKYNSELDLKGQIDQIESMRSLICAGPTLEGKFGFAEREDWEVSQKVLLDAKLIASAIDLDQAYSNAFVEAAPDELKTVNCPQ
ncbi:MAG: ABC transporter substrate-binding protein [Kiloniellales bacterium]